MFKTLITHEIQNLLRSQRVYWTIFMFLVLFASVFIVRVVDYQKQINQYIEDVKLAEERMQDIENYSGINPWAVQQPIVFSIYNQGKKIPRIVNIRFYEPIVESISRNEERYLLYIKNTQIDITFLVTFFLSLFILLISYDSVNAEKQDGTLRLLLTYPLKRQTFILQKILGVFLLVACTFTIPFLLSLICLVFIYADLLTATFFLSAFFYWFFAMLFILFFALLGIFISTCTQSPNRSLVYSLLVWILLSIVLPITWDYIFAPKLFNDRVAELDQIYQDKNAQARRIFYDEVPEDADIFNAVHTLWSGSFYNSNIWGYDDVYETHYRFQRYVIDYYYPASRQTEQAKDEVYRKNINMENMRNIVFFYNPIVLFESLSNKIAGNSQENYLKFLYDSRKIRDNLVSLGISEGWLLDYRFFAHFKEEYRLGDYNELLAKYNNDPRKVNQLVMETYDIAEPYVMHLPPIQPYEQPQYNFGEIYSQIYVYLVVFVVCILALWVMTWQRFMRYDVR